MLVNLKQTTPLDHTTVTERMARFLSVPSLKTILGTF